MARKRKDKPRFAGRIEVLEDRRVMSVDPLVDLLPPVDQFGANDPPAVEQHVEQPALGQPDFWIDASNQISLDDYLQQIDQMLASAHNLTGWYSVQQNYGFTGRGQTVAVIDSGIAYNHFALGGGLGANYRVVGGWDFTEENDSNPYDDGPNGSHGTHVSGIIGNNSTSNPGVATGVDFVGLRVFNDAGSGFFSWIENALRWVHDNRNSFANPITTVNLSLGVSSWNELTIPGWANLEDEFAQLKADGIFISVSAGNSFASFNTPGLSYPAASPYVVPVMSTNDAGVMSSYSQRLSRAIAAPGESIASTVPDYAGNNNGVADDFAFKSGTSMAAPYVAGAAVLIRQAMQFAGMTNITQDTIYNHMMATADTFFDAFTNQSYKRLNLGRAIDVLMPADDFGSTAAAAYNLGSMTGPLSINGKIAKLNDVDCFSFTAATTGKVTFSATCSAGMTPTWQVWNATALPGSAGTVSFNVVAGQTYTVGISSPASLGSYALTGQMDSTGFTFTDWGGIGFTEVNDVSTSGERWYRVQATRTGVLTAMASFNAAGGSVNLAFYNTNLQLLANGTTSGGQARADLNASANSQYYIRVTGTNADVDFKLANLLSQTGTTVTVGGTAGDDAYILATGGSHWLSVNGVSYGFALSAVKQINIDGGAGNDSLIFYGSAAAETVTLRAGSMTVASAGLNSTSANIETLWADGGGGADVAIFYDSAGNDNLQLAPRWAKFYYAGGASSGASGFNNVTAYATAGFDYVDMYDTAGNDTVSLWFNRVLLTGGGVTNDVWGFDLVAAHAWAGGADRATFYDSAGNDTFTAFPTSAQMNGAAYSNRVDGFKQTTAVGGAGGTDAAVLYDSTGDDSLQLAPNYANFRYANGTTTIATGYSQVTAYASTGFDFVDLWDSSGNDVVTLWPDRGLFVGGGATNDVRGFDLVVAHSVAGGVDSATMYDSTGNDGLVLAPKYGRFTYAGGAAVGAIGFANVLAYATSGFDFVDMYDSAGNDTVSMWADRTLFTGGGATNDVRGFKAVAVHGVCGGYDTAWLYDSAGNDAVAALAWGAYMQGGSYYNAVRGFDRVTATKQNGGTDTASVAATDYLFSLIGAWV
jgi:subtilisin family serine protease